MSWKKHQPFHRHNRQRHLRNLIKVKDLPSLSFPLSLPWDERLTRECNTKGSNTKRLRMSTPKMDRILTLFFKVVSKPSLDFLLFTERGWHTVPAPTFSSIIHIHWCLNYWPEGLIMPSASVFERLVCATREFLETNHPFPFNSNRTALPGSLHLSYAPTRASLLPFAVAKSTRGSQRAHKSSPLC